MSVNQLKTFTAMTSSDRDRNEEAIQKARTTPRRIFIFCDGTWQDGVNSGHAPTNIATLARCIEPIANDGYIQMSYYDSGVGNVTSKPAQYIDGATGRGISDKIRNAYSFLSHNYNFTGSDSDTEIYLFGFSRGAFAVQCLASLISKTGLLRSKQLYYLRGLFVLWSNQEFKPWLRGGSTESFVAAELDRAVADLKPVLRRVKIKALVVYDTVSSLGLPNPFTARPLSFVGKQVPKMVQFAFQALALDERRAAFQPVLWESAEEDSGNVAPVVKQCWFLGGHGDIGGNGDAALGAVTLLWVIGLLRHHTKVTFDDREIVRHLKHRLLEWEVRIPKLLGTFRDKSKLSTTSSSGRQDHRPRDILVDLGDQEPTVVSRLCPA
ncbi:hypothetical protein F5883DRAFT_71696 [Diaporthe sp. PMI_573]|nr:hypothetical protein F5883DRAFT_71696 [Diaporthaceae sp. PMI_573]